MHPQEKGLKRGLSARHIRFMALGSAMGAGLFYGSASAIPMAGPAVLLAYLIGGAIVFMLFVFGVLGYFPDTQAALLVGAIWIVLLVVAYLLWVKPAAGQAARVHYDPALSHR